MEHIDFIANYIKDLKDAIVYLVSGIIFLALTIGTFFLVYRKEKQKSDERYAKMNEQMIEAMKDETRAKAELKQAIESNTKVIERFPDIMEKSIEIAFKLAFKK